MIEWKHNSTAISELPEDVFGFIYRLTFVDKAGTQFYYVGKKNKIKETKLPALKNGEQRPNSTRVGKNKNGKRVYYDIVRKEDWLDYEGSFDKPEDLTLVYREVLHFSKSKRNLTYSEVKYQFIRGVLENENYLNKNILGSFYGPIQE